MKNYRIKKITYSDGPVYFPQRKILGFLWVNIYECQPYSDGCFTSLEIATEKLCAYIKNLNPKTEYIDVVCKQDRG